MAERISESSTSKVFGSIALSTEGLPAVTPPGHAKAALRPFSVQPPTGRFQRLDDDGAVGERIGTVHAAVVGGLLSLVGTSNCVMMRPGGAVQLVERVIRGGDDLVAVGHHPHGAPHR